MKRKLKLMIIDDEWNYRKPIYNSVLSEEFEIIAVEKASELFLKLESEEVDGYLVDIVLSEWKMVENNKPQEVIPVLEKTKNKPIILVSRQYDTLLNQGKLTSTINSIFEKKIFVDAFFLWSDFEREAKNKKDEKDYTNRIKNSIQLYLLKGKKSESIEMENKYDICVISALSDEIKPFREQLEERVSDAYLNISFDKGIITTCSQKKIKVIAIHQEKMGTVDTALVTSLIAQKYSVDHVIMIGVCGGRQNIVSIGDIIIPNASVAYQTGKINKSGFVAELNESQSNVNVKNMFQNKCDEILDEIFKSYVSESVISGNILAIKKPNLHFNEMACGDVVINKQFKLDRLAKTLNKPKLCAVDMESYSIFRMNRMFKVQTLVIKSVMDLTNNKTDQYKDYAIFLAASFLTNILRKEIYPISIKK